MTPASVQKGCEWRLASADTPLRWLEVRRRGRQAPGSPAQAGDAQWVGRGAVGGVAQVVIEDAAFRTPVTPCDAM